jgi:hypothetical protein
MAAGDGESGDGSHVLSRAHMHTGSLDQAEGTPKACTEVTPRLTYMLSFPYGPDTPPHPTTHPPVPLRTGAPTGPGPGLR